MISKEELLQVYSLMVQIETDGSNGSGRNMPPYRAVNIWKRTA